MPQSLRLHHQLFEVQQVPHLVLFGAQIAGIPFLWLNDEGDAFEHLYPLFGQGIDLVGIIGHQPDLMDVQVLQDGYGNPV